MILAADNLNVMNPKVLQALKSLDAEPLQEIVRQCEKAGAQAIDINPGYLSKRYEDRMAFMVETVQEISTMTLILDSSNPQILAKGLSACKKTPILNAASGEENRLKEILALAVEYKTPLIILLLDERSFSPPAMDEKIALALEIRNLALSLGLKDEDLIFDPVLPNLSWPDAFTQVSEVVKTVRMLDSGFIFDEPVKTMAGLSNLRSGFRERYPVEIEETCLSLLAGAGLDFVLANALNPKTVHNWRLINQMIKSSN